MCRHSWSLAVICSSFLFQGRAKVLELLQKDAMRRQQQVLEDREKREIENEQAQILKVEK